MTALRGMVPVWLCLASMAAAAESAEQWLLRMDYAISSISYRGTLLSMNTDRMDTLRIIHRIDEDGVRERIYALDGPPREVIRNRDQVRCLIAGQDSLIVNNPYPGRLLPRMPLDDILGPDSAYRLQAAGTGRVAGRDAHIFEIKPRDRYRYGRRLWLDAETAMLLRSVLFDSGGRVVEHLSFVDIELDAKIGDDELEAGLENPDQVASYRMADTARDKVLTGDSPSWLPESLPSGFVLTSVGRGHAASGRGEEGPEAGEGFEHLVFSDGMASFSIYVEPDPGAAIAEQVESLGAMHIYTGNINGRMVTVVGEVPALTVRMVGRHLRRLKQSSP
ncbi:MAG: MucB/RseB C-terminal domain-containing protein [Wenzhouxiangellaceae bacterium]|nr:MucB/RseB C-terminal domain-containing protein [Wenzhouxiangellaceae bacterium]